MAGFFLQTKPNYSKQVTQVENIEIGQGFPQLFTDVDTLQP